MIDGGNLNRQLGKLGSQIKTSVSDPENLGERKPNLVLEAPTCFIRDSSFLSTRQGGTDIPRLAGEFVIFLALTVKVLQGRTIIDKIGKCFYNPVRLLQKFRPVCRTGRKDFNGVSYINIRTLQKPISPAL